MSKESEKNIEQSFDLQKMDYVASAAKAVLGNVPFIGSLLVELAGTVIPNQRIERIAKFTKILAQRLDRIEQNFVKSQMKNEEFTDLIEEGLRQAARSLSDERREYIASLIANSLTSKDIEYQESKHLLRILSEMNDIEIIWLRFYLTTTPDEDQEFRDKHKEILQPISRSMGVPQSVHDKATLQDSYKEHLVQLGLLEKIYSSQLDNRTGGLKLKNYQLTSLGRLLLREIGLIS